MANSMGATEFKAGCLAIMQDVQARREPLTITRNGRPMVILTPAVPEDDPLAIYKVGGVEVLGDIESPAADPDDWEYD